MVIPRFIGQNTAIPQSETEKRTFFDCGTVCLQGGRYGEAYACYAHIREANGAVWFNRALCLFSITEYKKALDCLQKAERSLPAGTSTRSVDGLQTRLDEQDALCDGYLYPMAYDMPQLFVEASRLQILRVMVDVAYQAKHYDEVRRIAGFIGKHYKNVDDIQKLIR